MSKKHNNLLHKIILVIKWNSTDIIKLEGKWTLYFKSWHLTPMTAWWPITLLRPKTVRPGRWSPTTAPLPNTQFIASFFSKQIYIHIVTLINQCWWSELTASKDSDPQSRYFRKHGFQDIIDIHFQALLKTRLCNMDQLKHPTQIITITITIII